MLAMNGFLDRPADRTRVFLALGVVGEHIPRRDAVRGATIRVLACHDVFPKLLHGSTMLGDGAPARIIRTFRSMS